QPHGDAMIGELERFSLTLDPGQGGELAGARFERSSEEVVLDIVTERFEPDLARRKANFRRPDEPGGVVHDGDRFERSRMGAAALPNPQRAERIDGAVEESGRAMVWNSRAFCDNRCFHARGRKRNGSRESRGT